MEYMNGLSSVTNIELNIKSI